MTTIADRLAELASEAGELLEERRGARAERDFTKWANDPAGFLRDVLHSDPWARQVEIAEAVRDCPQVSVRSCHAAGKDWLAARLALWWVYSRDGLVILTGPTATQVEEILMRREIRTAFTAGKLPGDLHVRALRPTGSGEAGILARTGSSVQGMQGFHDARVLYIITEAQDPDIAHAWDAAFACTTGSEDRKLILGNPTEPTGRFYASHRPDSGWRTVKIASDDIPNVQEGRTVVPGLLTRAGVERFVREYGEDSPMVVSRVNAEFPDQWEDALISRAWLELAGKLHSEKAYRKEYENAEPILAVDPARYGPDSTVLAVRRGPRIDRLVSWNGKSTMDTVRLVERECEREGVRPRPDFSWGLPVRGHIVVDVVGLGAGVVDRLKEKKFRVHAYNGGQFSASKNAFNLRSDSYWRLRKQLEEGTVALPVDEKLWTELLALRWKPTSDGRVQMEKKTELKSRIGRSPDRADAVVMAFAKEIVGKEAGVFAWRV